MIVQMNGWGDCMWQWQSVITGSWTGMIKALTDMPVPKNKRELQAFLGIISYFGKFSPGMVGNM